MIMTQVRDTVSSRYLVIHCIVQSTCLPVTSILVTTAQLLQRSQKSNIILKYSPASSVNKIKMAGPADPRAASQ